MSTPFVDSIRAYLATAKDLFLRHLPWILFGGWVCFRWHWGPGVLFLAAMVTWAYVVDRRTRKLTPLGSVQIRGQRKHWNEYLYDISIGLCLFLSGWTTYKGFHDVFGVNDRIIWNIPFALVYAVAVTLALVYIAYRIRDEAKPLRLVALYLFVDLISVFSFNYLFFHERLRDELSLERERVLLDELATDQGNEEKLLSYRALQASERSAEERAIVSENIIRLEQQNVARWITIDASPFDSIPPRTVESAEYRNWVRDIARLKSRRDTLRIDATGIQLEETRIRSGVSERLVHVRDSLKALQFERDRPRMRQLVQYIKGELRTVAEQDSTLRPTVERLFKEPTPYVKAIADNYRDAFTWIAGGQEPVAQGMGVVTMESIPESGVGESVGRWMAVLPALLLDLVPLFLSLAFRRTNIASA